MNSECNSTTLTNCIYIFVNCDISSRIINDGEPERVRTRAILSVVVMVDVYTTLRICQTCARCPGIAVACGLCNDVVGAPLDNQLEGVSAGAVEFIGVLVNVGT